MADDLGSQLAEIFTRGLKDDPGLRRSFVAALVALDHEQEQKENGRATGRGSDSNDDTAKGERSESRAERRSENDGSRREGSSGGNGRSTSRGRKNRGGIGGFGLSSSNRQRGASPASGNDSNDDSGSGDDRHPDPRS